jgi:hypothetical protein
MRLKLQFRLRTLLIAVIAICLLLGVWKLYSRQFVEADPAVTGKPFKVHGRFVDFFGKESAVFVVNAIRNTDGERVIYQSGGGRVEKRGIGRYDFEVELAPIRREGEYDLELRPLTRTARGKHTDADSIWGRMVVSKQTNQQDE